LYQIQVKHQVLEDVDRPVEEGDQVTLSGVGRVDEEEGQEIWNESEIALPMDGERTFPGVPFVENIFGLRVDEEKEFSFEFSDEFDDAELAGKSATFMVKVLKIQSREVPELTDELADSEGDYETVADLRSALEMELEENAQRDSRSTMLDDFTTDLIAGSKIIYPPAAVDFELDRTLEETKQEVIRSGWQWNDYLQLQGETEASLREGWREGAVNRIERGFALKEFVNAEMLTVESSEIDEALEKRIESFGAEGEFQEELRKIFTQGQGLEVISNDVLVEKVKDRVEEIISGRAPDLETLRAEKKKELAEEEE
jgi:trigger factor